MRAPRILFFLLIIALIAVFSAGIKEDKIDLQTFLGSKPAGTPKAVDQNKIDLPVPLSNRSIAGVYLSYSFFGPVKEIKTQGSGKQIILDTTEKDLPDFIATDKDTKIFSLAENSTAVAATIDAVKKSARVSISTTYDLKTRVWITRSIYVIE